MPPNPQKAPPVVVLVPGETQEREIVHTRTLGRRKEEYAVVWPNGYVPFSVSHDSEVEEMARKAKVKKVKKQHKPGAERYERNPHEPIKC